MEAVGVVLVAGKPRAHLELAHEGAAGRLHLQELVARGTATTHPVHGDGAAVCEGTELGGIN